MKNIINYACWLSAIQLFNRFSLHLFMFYTSAINCSKVLFILQACRANSCVDGNQAFIYPSA